MRLNGGDVWGWGFAGSWRGMVGTWSGYCIVSIVCGGGGAWGSLVEVHVLWGSLGVWSEAGEGPARP